jgi:hypothetical protein
MKDGMWRIFLNSPPLTSLNGAPDMHPFHVHFVNMVVLRRWELQGGQFVLLPSDPKRVGLAITRSGYCINSF